MSPATFDVVAVWHVPYSVCGFALDSHGAVRVQNSGTVLLMQVLQVDGMLYELVVGEGVAVSCSI